MRRSSYYFEGFAQGLRWAYIYLRNNTIIEEGVWVGGDEVYSHHRSRIIAERRPIRELELKTIYGDGVHDDTEALQQRIDMGIDISNIIDEQEKLFNISKPLRFNPITEPVWSGEGLPPVGVECEVKRVAAWLPVKIEFISDTNTIFTTRGGTEECYHTHNLTFRPICSPEDVARDEAITSLYNVYMDIEPEHGDAVAEGIYDAIASGKIKGVLTLSALEELVAKGHYPNLVINK